MTRHEQNTAATKAWNVAHPERRSQLSQFGMARIRAKKKGMPFTLKAKDMPPIPEVCPVLGIPLYRSTRGENLDNSPSLDRIIPEFGYIPGNVRWISNRANQIKSDATAHELWLVWQDSEALRTGPAYAEACWAYADLMDPSR